MKRLEDYTDQQKIAKFDELYESCIEEMKQRSASDEHDEHYFWESVMERVTDMTFQDWQNYNNRTFPFLTQ